MPIQQSKKYPAFLIMVLAMIPTSNSAQVPNPWYMDFQPIFERSYGALEGGKTVQKTETLSQEEVEIIIHVLSSNVEFVSLSQRYIDGIKGVPKPLQPEEDAAMHKEILEYIDKEIEAKNLTMGYFFSNSISLEVFQRIEAGKIGGGN